MSRFAFVVLVFRTVAVLGGFAFAILVRLVADLVALATSEPHATDWRTGFPLSLVCLSFAVAGAGWMCWPLGPKIAGWLDKISPRQGDRLPLEAAIAVVGCFYAAIQVLTDAVGHDLDRWRTVQIFGSVQAWELEFNPYLDKTLSASAYIGVVVSVLAATLIVRRIAAGGYTLQPQTTISLTRRDVGFIAARTLAVLGWIYGLTAFAVVFTEALRSHGASKQGVHVTFTYDLIGHGFVYGLAMAAVSAWLWVQAEHFGGEPVTDDSSPILVSRNSLLRGVMAAVGIVFAAKGVPPLAMWAYDAIAQNPGLPSVVQGQIVEAIVNISVSATLILWSSRTRDAKPRGLAVRQ